MANFTASEFLLAAPTVSEETFSGAFASEGFFTAPAISQVHPFEAVSVAIQEYTFLPVGLVVGQVLAPPAVFEVAPVDYQPATLTQNHPLTASSIEATPVVPIIEMVLQIPLAANGIEIDAYSLPIVDFVETSVLQVETFEVFAPLLRPTTLISANTVHFAVDLDGGNHGATDPVITGTHVLNADDLVGPDPVETPSSITQTHAFAPQNIELALYDIEQITSISATHVLAANDVAVTTELTSPVLTVKYTPSVFEVLPDVPSLTLTQHHGLDAADIETTIEPSPVVLTQTQPLAAQGLTAQIEVPDVSLAHSLEPVDLAIGPYRLQRSAFQSNEEPIFQEYQFDSFQRYDAFQTFAFLGYAIGVLNQVHTVEATLPLTAPDLADTPITQIHTIEADETTNIPVLDTATITQVHDLPAPNDISSQIVIPTIEMIQTALLDPIGFETTEPEIATTTISQIHRSVAQIALAEPILPILQLRQNHVLAPDDIETRIRFERTSVFAPTIIATYDLFTAISYVFEFDEDAENIEFVAPITCDTSFRGFNFGLPLGITYQDNIIEGVISPFATPGFYYFEILLTIDGVAEKRPYAIRLTDRVNTTIPVVPKIEWRTPAGSLGRLREGDASYFMVEAGSTTNTAVTFSLRDGALPPGLELSTNGEIRGVALPVLAERSFDFTIRATTRITPTTGAPDQIAYEDRSFSLTIGNLFSAPVIYDVFLKPTNQQSFELKNPYRGVLTEDHLFRPTDPSFGIPRSSFIYLLGGIGSLETIREATDPDGLPVVPRTPLSFHEIKRLKIGEHGVARARDVNGNVVYEVLYRLLLDPQATAGGFSFPRGETRIPVIYNDGSDGIKNVFPNSIRNARLDLIQKVGFAVSDPGRSRSLASERLPLWMRSRQDAADPNSVLSFVPAIVIAYLKPGHGEQVSRLIAQNGSRLPKTGRILNINTYFVKSFPSTNDGAIFLPDAASA